MEFFVPSGAEQWEPDCAEALFAQSADRARQLVSVADYEWAQVARPGLLTTITEAEARVNAAWSARDLAAMRQACREYLTAWEALADAARRERPLTADEVFKLFNKRG